MRPSPCGRRGGKLRILSGDKDGETSYGEFPWMLAIFRRRGKDWKFRCGGSLIRMNMVLTAAHSVKRFAKSPELLMVRAGAWDLMNDLEDPNVQEMGVSRVIIHENFNERGVLNDIAVLKTSEAFRADSNVGIVCLTKIADYFPPQKRCIVAGWGYGTYDLEPTDTVMRQVVVPLVSREHCQNQLRRTALSRYFTLHENNLCAGGEKDVDACTGDGGGPLVCEVDGRYFQVGIVSWGVGCGKEDVPGLYVDVTKFINWIVETYKTF
ncbi:phenoloxidase-activating factor 2 [Anabrus simplex]|uniref:phenoloxidase-activating factor 2 n=1 Tax=Anabrus simplex TaxID=316456 RepID=UPI0035A34F49